MSIRKLLQVYEKLGIPLREQEILAGVKTPRIAVDAVFDSVSVVTTFKEELKKAGVIFMSISEAIREHPDLVKKYLGTVVPTTDNYYATLNSAVFTDGSFVYHPEGRSLPDGTVDLFPYQREGHRPVRAHADHRGRGRLRLLSGRLHGAAARRKPAACRRRRTGCAGRCRNQVFDRPELVSGRQERQGRHLQLRHQAWRLPRQELEDFVDAGRDRLGDHLEIPVLHPARRWFARRVLFDRRLQRPPADRQSAPR